ncbi:MAG TPA: choice-of-anchor L domain-containing protein [bacterium]|nr:choice-of-anchor L domain-containing protein [bacterium]
MSVPRIAVLTVVFFFIAACDGAKTIKPKDDDVLSGDDDSLLSDDPATDDLITDTAGTDDTVTDTTAPDDTITDTPPVDNDIAPVTCGNGDLDFGEICDKSTGTLANCTDINSDWYQGGKAYCQDDCLGWDTSTCEEVPHECGNNTPEGPEVCDGGSIPCATLSPEKYQSGTAYCNGDCNGWLTDGCVEIEPSECKDGKVEGIEVCDGGPDGKANIADCIDIDPLLYSGGKAYCNANCDGWLVETCTERPPECESTLNLASKDPYHYAKAIGICSGVPKAEMLLPSGSTGANATGHALLDALGDVITPRGGDKMMVLSSGQAMDPPDNTSFDQQTSSTAPADWYADNGNKYPSSPACGGTTGTTGNTNDGVMARFEVDVPSTARSFSFDIYFLSVEYPSYVCSAYNDLFVALLDSSFTTTVEAQKNPIDGNLAVYEGNAVGVNLAPAGLFTQCTNTAGTGWEVTSCEGTEELAGTGFEGKGGTGWLTVRGNVVPNETMTLRLAIWDLGDHILDSMVLIDNFKWGTTNVTPGMTKAQ